MSGPRVCRPAGARSLFLLDPGAARCALAPGYLLAAPSALDARDAFCRAYGGSWNVESKGCAMVPALPDGPEAEPGA